MCETGEKGLATGRFGKRLEQALTEAGIDTECWAMKTCSKCNTMQSLENFASNRRSKDGLTYECKGCIAERMKAWRMKNLDSQRKKGNDRYHENKASYQKTTKDWVKKNMSKVAESSRAWHMRKKEEISNLPEQNRDDLAKHKKTIQKRSYQSKIDSLSDGYVRGLIVQGTRIQRTSVPAELVEAKRIQLQIKRLLKGQSQ